MTYTLSFTGDLSTENDGAIVYGQLYDSDGNADGSPITSGIVELMTGTFQYVATLADGYRGSFVMYVAGDTDQRVAFSINPQESENADTKTSTRSSHSAANVVTAMQAVAGDFQADVSAVATQASVDALNDLSTADIDARLAAYDAATGAEAAAISSAIAALNNIAAADVVTALMAYAVESGKSYQQALLDIWSVLVGDSAANDANAPTSITYDSPDGTVQITHTLTTTTRAVA